MRLSEKLNWFRSRETVRQAGTPVRKRIHVHIILFILTILSTFFVGLGSGPVGALWYSLGIMAILLTHEMGHYLMARKYGVPVTLPYFIPLPISIFGTMGAVIKMGGYIPNRRVLFDIGVAGPLAGMAVIVPLTIIGLRFSNVVELSTIGKESISLGNSLFFSLLTLLVVGPLQPGTDIVLHPLAFAGWAGLLVTALNLLPIGQLDGGHILYSLFRRKSRFISSLFLGILLLICLFYFVGWILLLVLLIVFRKHPATIEDDLPLDAKRRAVGGLALLILVLSFTPVPFTFGKGLIPLLFQQFGS
jgi:membrane-associated protease RseP (regulator of RpoE activity)